MNPLGSSTTIETVSGATLTNGFSTIRSNDIDSIIASNSVSPNQIKSGLTSNATQIFNTDGSYMLIGRMAATGELGIAFYDKNDNLQAKYLGATDYKYRSDGTNYWQAGTLPDGTQDIVIAATGEDLPGAFS